MASLASMFNALLTECTSTGPADREMQLIRRMVLRVSSDPTLKPALDTVSHPACMHVHVRDISNRLLQSVCHFHIGL